MENQTNNQPQATLASNCYGPFYFSRDDRRLYVPYRIGYGWTLNFGRPMAYAVLGLLVAIPTVVGAIIVACNG